MKKILIVLVLLAVSLSGVALASFQDVPVGKCSIPLDFGRPDILIDPSETSVTDESIMDTTSLIDRVTDSTGYVYIFNFSQPLAASELENRLNYAMETLCARVSTESYINGFIATGLLREGGQRCWGVVLPLDVKDNKANRVFMLVSMFKNETLNEQLVKTVKLEELKCK